MKVSIIRWGPPPGQEPEEAGVPAWRRAARRVGAALLLAVTLPVLWLLGTVALGALLLVLGALLLLGRAPQA